MSTYWTLVNDARLMAGTDPVEAYQLLLTASDLLAQVTSAHAEMLELVAAQGGAMGKPPGA